MERHGRRGRGSYERHGGGKGKEERARSGKHMTQTSLFSSRIDVAVMDGKVYYTLLSAPVGHTVAALSPLSRKIRK